MQVTGMLYGSRLLRHVGLPATELLGPAASEDEIRDLIQRHGLIFIKPLFKGGVGKKGKAGLIGKRAISRPPWPRRNASPSSSTAAGTPPPRPMA